MKQIIGLTGLARSGKDTVALHLNENAGYSSYAFAQPIKQACKVIFNWSKSHVNGELKEVVDPLYGVSPRMAMQSLGTEWGRESINSSIWLLRAQSEIQSNSKLVITDIRFNNEAELIKENGGIVIEVRRNDRESVYQHKSELGISPQLIDFTIDNNGSISELYNQVDEIIRTTHT